MVRKVGLEPTCLTAPPPQDGASANSATSAFESCPRSIWVKYCIPGQSTSQRHGSASRTTFSPGLPVPASEAPIYWVEETLLSLDWLARSVMLHWSVRRVFPVGAGASRGPGKPGVKRAALVAGLVCSPPPKRTRSSASTP